MTTATARSPRRESCLAVSHATDSSAASNPKTATTTGTSNVRAGSPSRPAARRNARTHRAAHSRARVDRFETRSTVSSTLGRSSANLAHRGMRERARARRDATETMDKNTMHRTSALARCADVIVHRETDAREIIHHSREISPRSRHLRREARCGRVVSRRCARGERGRGGDEIVRRVDGDGARARVL